ncbi:sensor histidine kinase [Streptomyces sp. NBC_01465]|uniref:sensor histidine kinase n=1 Tax=Streptomyces sp. NBC_01465 TaxID=2903878 RepID=UPI002E35A5E0|nr:ATP-binding protein [Streptomyces sp. NBC_01465]
MHDILGHTLSVIVSLAGGAAGLTEAKPKRGAETLRIIADSGRGALAELRRLLAVVGEEPGSADDTPLAPQPGLADLEPLLDRVRGAGPRIALRTEGDLTPLAPGLQLAVYRIVQEALTNILKHAAPDTTAQVTVMAVESAGPTADDDTVHVTVEDTGPPRSHTAAFRSDDGRGLVGMRQRAALYEGSVAAGPNARGGWTVHARLRTTLSHRETHTA